jgi:hypothetical protein
LRAEQRETETFAPEGSAAAAEHNDAAMMIIDLAALAIPIMIYWSLPQHFAHARLLLIISLHFSRLINCPPWPRRVSRVHRQTFSAPEHLGEIYDVTQIER